MIRNWTGFDWDAVPLNGDLILPFSFDTFDWYSIELTDDLVLPFGARMPDDVDVAPKPVRSPRRRRRTIPGLDVDARADDVWLPRRGRDLEREVHVREVTSDGQEVRVHATGGDSADRHYWTSTACLSENFELAWRDGVWLKHPARRAERSAA